MHASPLLLATDTCHGLLPRLLLLITDICCAAGQKPRCCAPGANTSAAQNSLPAILPALGCQARNVRRSRSSWRSALLLADVYFSAPHNRIASFPSGLSPLTQAPSLRTHAGLLDNMRPASTSAAAPEPPVAESQPSAFPPLDELPALALMRVLSSPALALEDLARVACCARRLRAAATDAALPACRGVRVVGAQLRPFDASIFKARHATHTHAARCCCSPRQRARRCALGRCAHLELRLTVALLCLVLLGAAQRGFCTAARR
jgi:hypothetical protein